MDPNSSRQPSYEVVFFFVFFFLISDPGLWELKLSNKHSNVVAKPVTYAVSLLTLYIVCSRGHFEFFLHFHFNFQAFICFVHKLYFHVIIPVTNALYALVTW